MQANPQLEDFFEVEIKVDVLLLRMVLDIVTKCLKTVEVAPEAFENSAFLNSSQRFDRHSILDAIDQVENDNQDFNNTGYMSQLSGRNMIENTDRSDYSSSRGLVGQESARGNYGFKLDIVASEKARKEELDQQL